MSLWRRFDTAPGPWGPWLRTLVRLVVGAAVVTLVVEALGFPDEPAAWAVVAVVVVVGDTTGQTVAASWNRTEGSVVGCLSGAVVQVALPMVPLALRVVLAMALCLVACRLLRIGAGWRLGVALAGFFVFVPGAQEGQTVGWRLGATRDVSKWSAAIRPGVGASRLCRNSIQAPRSDPRNSRACRVSGTPRNQLRLRPSPLWR